MESLEFGGEFFETKHSPSDRALEQALVIGDSYSVRSPRLLLPCQILCRLIGHIGPPTTLHCGAPDAYPSIHPMKRITPNRHFGNIPGGNYNLRENFRKSR